MTGWKEDRMTGLKRMNRWPDNGTLHRRLTTWYIYTLYDILDLKAYLMSECGSTMFAWKYLAFLPSSSNFLCLLKTPNYNAICKAARAGATHLWSPVFSQFHYFTIWCNSVIHPDTPPSPPWPNPTQPNPTCLLTQTCFSIYLKYDSDESEVLSPPLLAADEPRSPFFIHQINLVFILK